ncbi:MAG: SDR family NAD(P)-dependent oxidoreductase [Actinobacteria bacterium]|nr:SDR family NAD(P)-dependent oxidoreductase [Actinomycetota bacterium]
MNISGKVALVTGGASGLGLATTNAILEAGGSVMIVDLPSSDGETVAKELGDNCRFAPVDVTVPEDVEGAVASATEAFGALHIVVNCAGVGFPGRVLTRDGSPIDLERFEFVVKVNLIGTFNVVRIAAAQMAAQEPDGEERGVIINTASIAAFDGQIGQAAYSASKGGIVGMTLPIARDLASKQIRCVAIAPGTFDTPMLAGLPEEAKAKLAEGIPHPHRLGNPVEFGALVKHIVENPMLNGETIRLDGALRMPPR